MFQGWTYHCRAEVPRILILILENILSLLFFFNASEKFQSELFASLMFSNFVLEKE